MPHTDEEHMRRLTHDFTVESLLFAFESLEWLGDYRPDPHDTGFRISRKDGERVDNPDDLARALCVIKAMAPAAVGALQQFGEPTPEGTDAGGALLEACARWQERQED